jgi:hypothetical protein
VRAGLVGNLEALLDSTQDGHGGADHFGADAITWEKDEAKRHQGEIYYISLTRLQPSPLAPSPTNRRRGGRGEKMCLPHAGGCVLLRG